MSDIASELRAVGAGIRSRAVGTALRVRRTRPVPALTRLVAAAGALAALAVAVPTPVLASPWSSVLLLFAAGVGLFPRTSWVTLVMLLAVLSWVISTMVYGDDVALWRLAALACGLYVSHAGATLAAVLPYDCVVAPAVVLRWAGRMGAVLAVSLCVALVGMVAARQLPAAPTVVGPIVGSLLAAGLAGLLAWHLRRP